MISHKEHKDHKEFSMCLYVFYVAKTRKEKDNGKA